MGQITSLFVHKVIAQANDTLDKPALFKSVGVDPDAAVDPKRMIEDTDYYRFIERIARADPRAVDLPLRVGASMRCDDYGAYGLAWKSALNLRGSCERAERYARVLTSVSSYSVSDTEEGALMLLHREGERRLGLRLSNENTIASIVAMSQEVSTTEFRAKAIFFKHRSPGSAAAHERHFGCPVHFGADMDGLLIAHEVMLTPNQLGDRSISQFFDQHLEEAVSNLSEAATLERQVRDQIAQSLSEGVPTITEIAERLNLSGRTLQRRLSDRGYSFQTLVDDSRRELAKRLLKETDYPLAEIAFLTGFSEQSAFTRAFKRWAGQTPRSFRIEP